MDNFSGYIEQEQRKQFIKNHRYRKNEEKSNLMVLSAVICFCIALYVLIQNGIMFFIEKMELLPFYKENPFFRSGIDIILSIFGLFLPFALGGAILNKTSKKSVNVPLGKAKDKNLFIFGTVACIGAVMFSNIISSYISYFVNLTGAEIKAPEIPLPEGIGGIVLSVLRVGLMTAIIEEYALRGVVLENLRKYGDSFAIFFSALIFALMHGNFAQGSYAFFSGIALGYFAVKSGTIWTSITAHAACNAISVIASYGYQHFNDQTIATLYSYILYAFIFAGIFCFFVFFINTKNTPLKRGDSVLSFSEKLISFLTVPVVTTIITGIVAVVIYLIK